MQMEILPRYSCLLAIFLSSCSLTFVDTTIQEGETLPTILQIQSEELLNVAQPKTPIVVAVYPNSFTDQIVHKFKNPSFSGINTSSHYLTIENQEFNRKMSIKEEIKALQEQIERDKENTTLARFIRNLESRIYAQLSRQLVENLFGETPSTEGTLTLEGNTIEIGS